MTLFPFQQKVLEDTKNNNKVAYYLDMGLGKTFIGAEKAMSLNRNILVICQKSKIKDWVNHFKDNYDNCSCYDIRSGKLLDVFMRYAHMTDFRGVERLIVGVINYDLVFRRPQLGEYENFTLMLDESSLIQNETARRSKFILKNLHPENVILLSGTPCNGRYEGLLSQLHLLGWTISKQLYWNQYIEYRTDMSNGFPLKIVTGYKNVDRLKAKMRDNGCVFMKSDEVLDLPKQIDNHIMIEATPDYRKFKKSRYVEIDGTEFIGDTIFTRILNERMLCGHLNRFKLQALKDYLQSTDERVLIFYNFNAELAAIEDICNELDKPISFINGSRKDLSFYDGYKDSVTLIQYQSGAMGLNLQKANRIIYFTPPLSSELFEQSKKRIHRIGQRSRCFYDMLTVKGSIEERIYKALEMRKDYTDELFEEESDKY